jgi:hypothetical protein
VFHIKITYVSLDLYELVSFLCYVLKIVEVLFPQLFYMFYFHSKVMFNTNINQDSNIQDVEQMLKHKLKNS